MLTRRDLEWTQMIPGVAFAPAYGDWQSGRHGKFVRFEPGASAPLHTHSSPYNGIVLEGRLSNPYAGKVEPAEMKAGTHWYVPAAAEHGNTCVSEQPCLLYTYGDAAWDIAVVEE